MVLSNCLVADSNVMFFPPAGITLFPLSVVAHPINKAPEKIINIFLLFIKLPPIYNIRYY